MSPYFVISRYQEDVSWLKDYSINYIIYNKGDELLEYNCIAKPNIGNNQRDILEFIVDNYDNLPEYAGFIQGTPFDHCYESYFKENYTKQQYVSFEHYGRDPESSYHKNDLDMGYLEINNNWYISSHNATHGISCRYSSFDEFMDSVFADYSHLEWIRFCPGSQYIVPKTNILYYPKSFWNHLSTILNKISMSEGHIIERAMFLIFSNIYTVREEFR